MKPQYIEIDEDGSKFYYSDKEMKILHREDGPAVEYNSGYKSWWLNGKYHREDGPAIEWQNGDKYWYCNGKFHRENGPAVESSNGSKYWYLNGELHREDGPAIEWADGDKWWYLNGIEYSESQFNKKMKPSKKININGKSFTVEEFNSLIDKA